MFPGVGAADQRERVELVDSGLRHPAPALTIDRVYVSTNEMLTDSFDLKTRAHDTS